METRAQHGGAAASEEVTASSVAAGQPFAKGTERPALAVALDPGNVDGGALRSLVEYMYTGDLELSGASVLPALSASNFLEMGGAKALCERFLESKLDPSNAL